MREQAPPAFSVLCLGNFDGVHLGHRALIAETVQQKESLSATYKGLASAAWLFSEPPSRALSGEAIPQLTATNEKLTHFAELGLDYAFIADFSELRDLEPLDFVDNVLKQKCNCIYAVCGFNFRFAKKAMADAFTLRELMDGRTTVLDCVTLEGTPVSSSAIRSLLSSGNTEEANRMLGYSFSLSSEVLHGKALGKTIGIPTVNQRFKEGRMRPADGVYVSRAWIDGVPFPAVTNIGTRPTFADGESVSCETHIIGYEGDLYGRRLKIDFLKRLRGEIRFPCVKALQAQLKTDIANALDYFDLKRRHV